MAQASERHEFQAEVTQLLDLMVHSLYSNRDVFLRELISNASDALDKRRFEALTDARLAAQRDLDIRLVVDAQARTLAVVDNGIGMTRDEVIRNLGTIARSGTKEFTRALKAASQKSDGQNAPELIGQFGVGFYAAFMVASCVSVVTRRAGENTAIRWESHGDGAYTIGEAERDEAGTTVTLTLKPTDAEAGLQDLTQTWALRSIVKRYSDFVAYPIRIARPPEGKDGANAGQDATDAPEMPAAAKPNGELDAETKALPADDVALTEGAQADSDSNADDAAHHRAEGDNAQYETLNAMKAIWDRPKGEVSEEEYKDFYRAISHDWQEPLRHIQVTMEGAVEAYSLLYIPSKAPSDLYSQEMKRGVQLYVKRVFVMDECKDLVPTYLRFIKGVVDAHDLSLNVSREILQKDRQIAAIRKQLVKKVLGALKDMQAGHLEDYLRFWAEFGPALKEGLLGYETQDHDKLLQLVMAYSTKDAGALCSLQAYVERKQPDQDVIYFLTGATKEVVAQSPLLEKFVNKGYEVLLFSDTVDEIWLEHAPKYKSLAFKSIAREDISLGSDEDRKKETDALNEKKKEMGGVLSAMQAHLQEELKEVRLSSRLTTSAACLVSDENDPSPRMQRIMEQLGQAQPKVKRILELNPSHAVVAKLHKMYADNAEDRRIKLYADLLLGQAHLSESAQVPDPAAFGRVLGEAMLQGV